MVQYGSEGLALTKQQAKQVIEEIVKKLVREYHPERVVLFGSYAAGNPRPDSDIDLLIIKDTPDQFMKRLVTVRRILSDPKRKISLETIVLTPQEVSRQLAKGDQFIAEIIEKGKVLYAA